MEKTKPYKSNFRDELTIGIHPDNLEKMRSDMNKTNKQICF